MTNQMIRRYAIEAVFAETGLVKTRANCGITLIGMMKDDGYVPLIDVNPVWETYYDEAKDKFRGTLTMQGVYVGEDKAWQIDGMMDGKLIPSTPRSK